MTAGCRKEEEKSAVADDAGAGEKKGAEEEEEGADAGAVWETEKDGSSSLVIKAGHYCACKFGLDFDGTGLNDWSVHMDVYLEALPALIDKNSRIHTSYGQQWLPCGHRTARGKVRNRGRRSRSGT